MQIIYRLDIARGVKLLTLLLRIEDLTSCLEVCESRSGGWIIRVTIRVQTERGFLSGPKYLVSFSR